MKQNWQTHSLQCSAFIWSEWRWKSSHTGKVCHRSCYFDTLVCSKQTVAFTASFPINAFGTLDQCMWSSSTIDVWSALTKFHSFCRLTSDKEIYNIYPKICDWYWFCTTVLIKNHPRIYNWNSCKHLNCNFPIPFCATSNWRPASWYLFWHIYAFLWRYCSLSHFQASTYHDHCGSFYLLESIPHCVENFLREWECFSSLSS